MYELLESTWRRYHAHHCGCDQDWLSAHAEPAGFTVVRDGGGFLALIGPDLTEGVNESALTTDALWLAVTGKAGGGRIAPVHTVDRSAAAEAQRKADNDAHYQAVRKRAAAAKVEPASAAQIRYLDNLAARVSRDQLQIEYGRAVKGAGIAPLESHDEPGPALARLTKAAARRRDRLVLRLPQPPPPIQHRRREVTDQLRERRANRDAA